jgi:metallo-beta-lactamase family protein
MCTGGRVRHHLKHHLWRRDSSIIFVGYAAEGTLARHIIDGARSVYIFHEEIPVNAQIQTIGGFSAHADRNELLTWWHAAAEPQTTVLVHGDPAAIDGFAKALPEGAAVMCPDLHDELLL